MQRILAAPALSRRLVGAARQLSTVVKYTKSHEYISVQNGVGTVGITDFAQAALGDVVFVGLPEAGATFKKGASFASVESVKAASDVYLPVSGTIKEVNGALSADPGAVNKAAESSAWFARVTLKDAKELDTLLDAAAYKALCDAEKH